ncbi:MAG: ATP-dependent Clp protease ATP-binding subunit [bacterium]|nr:ATP-dependent Clp protease ATP-binding subunit [bacterium]
MTPNVEPELIVCRVCNGDPRASLSCRECRGRQVTLKDEDGYAVWGEHLDGFVFQFRRTRSIINAVVNLAIGLLAFVGVFAFGFTLVRLMNFSAPLSASFWTAGYWYVNLLWLGLVLFCFLYFRIRAYGMQVKTLPHWGELKHKDRVPSAGQDERHAMDISIYFQKPAWTLLEQAFHVAEKLDQVEVEPVHLFAAALGSSAGGIFSTRLGMDFAKVKEGMLVIMRKGQTGTPTLFSLEAKKILLLAYHTAKQNGRRSVGTIELFLQSFLADKSLQDTFDGAGYPLKHVMRVADWIRMQEQLKEEYDRFRLLAQFKPKGSMNRSMTAQQTPLLNQYSEDLTELARNGYVPALVGRQQEMEELMRAIESGKRAVAVIGEPGVGKRAMLEGLARRMVEEDVPGILADRRLVSVQLPQLISGGDPMERLLGILLEVGMSGNIVLVLEGIEALVGNGLGGTLDLAEALATELDKGYLLVIGTTTEQTWTAYLERRSLGPKFAKVLLQEMNEDDAMAILMAKTGSIEYQNSVFFSYAALEKTVELSGRYIRDLHLPESALEIAKESAVQARKKHGDGEFVTAEDVATVIHEKTRIPVEAVTRDESEKLLNLEDRLHKRVIGQDEAVIAVASAIRRARAEMREGKRPIANFLFLGPTGVGKTELAKAVAAEYFGSETAMVRLDMSEYQDPSAAYRVIGAPGDQRGGLLTEAVRKMPFSIVLLDELEKAHPDVLTLFLQVMDDGRLTDGVGRTVDFTNVVLIATSNAGTNFIQDQVRDNVPTEQIKTALLERELKGIFRPEFLNRFDGIIVFKPLTLDDVTQIAWLMINGITKRLEEKGIAFRAEDAAVEELAQAGFDPLFGARPLRRVIQERVDNGLADLLLKNAVHRRDTVTLMPGGKLEVTTPDQLIS